MDQLGIFDFIILACAIDAVMLVWFRGGLFKPLLATAEAWSASTKTFKHLLGKHLACSICLPFSLAGLATLALLVLPCPSRIVLFTTACAGLSGRLHNQVWPRLDHREATHHE